MIQPLILVRLVLAACVAISWSALQRTLQLRIGSTFSRWYTLITISQFHFMFYMSRTLPNIIALPFGDYFLITISVNLTMTYLSPSHRFPWVKTCSCTNKITFVYFIGFHCEQKKQIVFARVHLISKISSEVKVWLECSFDCWGTLFYTGYSATERYYLPVDFYIFFSFFSFFQFYWR